jgi:hypothetical protein
MPARPKTMDDQIGTRAAAILGTREVRRVAGSVCPSLVAQSAGLADAGVEGCRSPR